MIEPFKLDRIFFVNQIEFKIGYTLQMLKFVINCRLVALLVICHILRVVIHLKLNAMSYEQ